MHEHVFVLTPEVQQNVSPGWDDWDEDAGVANAVGRLEEAKRVGVDTIVDLTVLGLGRNVPLVKRAADRVEVNIVVATGLYTWDWLPFYWHQRPVGANETDLMTELFVRDITEGIAETGVKAGILKCAIDHAGMTPDVERVLRAVGQAHRETGVPISTHTNGSQGNLQQDIFESLGVDLTRVVIGHSHTTNLDYLRRLMDRGSYIGLDQFGYEHISQDRGVDLLIALCQEGRAEQIVLSHDCPCFSDCFGTFFGQGTTPPKTYAYVHREILPRLRNGGVPDEAIEAMIVKNPRRLFEAQGRY
jgi:phosphotriesterase-related protein